MNFGIAFAPLVSAQILWAAIAAVPASWRLLLFVSRSRGAAIRALGLALIVLALANPSLTREDRDPLSSVAVVVVDKSPSQNFGDRARQTEEARAAIVERLSRIPGLDVRVVEAGQSDGETDGTRLFTALGSTLADVPADRIAGAIMITDGRVHDVPADAGALGFAAPVHALITGNKNERDRRVALIAAPRFGIVGQSQTITYQVEDQGAHERSAAVTVRRDGDVVETRTVPVGTPQRVDIPIPHGGPNIVEIEAAPLAGELTPVNNRAVVNIDGVRDKLRVLLVSGEPNAGERTWRNLLKSDASVDLVHFTILRPPEKQDGTPINELSLIAFPTRELFQQKIGEFQLIIFDRYARQGVLPMIYFDNITRYVRDGGAVLVAAGPDYASQTSIWRTPLDAILPAEPSGNVTERGFHARLTELGKRHPVTRDLDGSAERSAALEPMVPPCRYAESARGTAVMQGAGQQAAARSFARRRRARGAAVVRPALALGARLPRRRPASRSAAPAFALADEGTGARGRSAAADGQRPSAPGAAADHGGGRRRRDVDLALGRDAHAQADADRARRLGSERHRQRARAVARDRRQAQRAGQYRSGQSARVRRSDVDHRGAARRSPTAPAAIRAASMRAAASTCRAFSRCAPATPTRATIGSA